MSSKRLLRVHEQRLQAFLKELDEYDFEIREYPVEFHKSMGLSEFLEHFYAICQAFITGEYEITIGKVFVLYGVSTFEQKTKTNEFIIAFLISLERYYFESHEVEFAIELINAFMDDLDLLREKLSVLIKIKQRLTLHYLNNRELLSQPLDNIVVNCTDWQNLFKSLSFLFSQYSTTLIKRLMTKFDHIGIQEGGNKTAGSIFARAVFLLQEEEVKDDEVQQRKLKHRLDEKKKKKTNKRIKQDQFLKESLAQERQKFLSGTGTLGRIAQRERNEYQTMYKLRETDTEELMNTENEVLYKDLEALDQIIYKEGRIKRKRQNLLDSLLSTLQENTTDYDNLLELTELMALRYKELMDFIDDTCPEEKKNIKGFNFDNLPNFRKHHKLYQKAMKLNMLK